MTAWQDRRGMGATEWAFVAGLIGIALFFGVSKLGKAVSGHLDNTSHEYFGSAEGDAGGWDDWESGGGGWGDSGGSGDSGDDNGGGNNNDNDDGNSGSGRGHDGAGDDGDGDDGGGRRDGSERRNRGGRWR